MSTTWRITSRRSVGLLLAVCLAMTAACGAGETGQGGGHEEDRAAARFTPSAYAGKPRIVFRNTERGAGNGLVAVVPLADPGAARALTDIACDRVDATRDRVSCLQTQRGVATRYRWLDLDADFDVTARTPLVGIPSRTRLSPDGKLVASTVFVSQHSYEQTGFSTATVVREVGGKSFGNLEKFRLVLDGNRVRPADRNVWGVTFAGGDRFYASVGTAGTSYLVRGDLSERTLTSVRRGAECPSLSPDRTRVAYKVDRGTGPRPDWGLAVLDLSTGEQVLLDRERRNVDDQVAWLDDETVLYGLPRTGEPGVSDVWALPADGKGAPRRFLDHAWSPAVVR